MSIRTSTRYALGIFYEGEEVDGFTMYGYWPREQIVPSKLELEYLGDLQFKFSRLAGSSWTVGVWDVPIQIWPTADVWPHFVQGALHQILRSGALVSWCAVEGSFVDPPNLFDPQFMSAGVWAACTADGLQLGPPALDAPLEFLSDDQLLRLHRLVLQPSDK
jgi:hypothetical protein